MDLRHQYSTHLEACHRQIAFSARFSNLPLKPFMEQFEALDILFSSAGTSANQKKAQVIGQQVKKKAGEVQFLLNNLTGDINVGTIARPHVEEIKKILTTIAQSDIQPKTGNLVKDGQTVIDWSNIYG